MRKTHEAKLSDVLRAPPLKVNSQSPPMAHAAKPTDVMARSEFSRTLVFMNLFELIGIQVGVRKSMGRETFEH
jgi:hypothetical protein